MSSFFDRMKANSASNDSRSSWGPVISDNRGTLMSTAAQGSNRPTGILADSLVGGPNKSPGPWAGGYTTEEESLDYWKGVWKEAKERDYVKPDADMAQWTPIHQKPFRFNPPLHSLSRPVRVDFGSGWQQGEANAAAVQKSLERYLDDPTTEARTDLADFEGARLGRIVQSDHALGGAQRGDYRWGFRFMYNPETLTTAVSANNQVMIDFTSQVGLVLSQASNRGSFQRHQFSLLLNRIADLESGGPLLNDYAPYSGVLEEDTDGIRERGTMWDLEYLFRVANGVWPLEEMGESGNIGLLQPNPAFLILGSGINHYGFINSVNYNHVRFTPNMIPILTQVTVSFDRIMYISPEDAEEWHGTLGYYAGAYDDQFEGAPVSTGSGDSGSATTSEDKGATIHAPGDVNTSRPEYERVTTPQGQVLAARMVAQLQMASNKVKENLLLHVTQGSYSTRVAASGGTHAGGGAVDLVNSAWNTTRFTEICRAMREVGIIAWHRTPSQGNWPHHVHGIDRGAKDLSSQAAVQVQNWKDGLNGLRGTSPDDGPKVDVPIFKYVRTKS